MTRKDFEVIARIISNLSFHLKDGCFIIGDSQSYDALMLEELHETVNSILRQTNPNYNEERFWNAVYKNRQNVIDVINNA